MGGNKSLSGWGHNIGGGVRGEGCDEPKVEPNIATTCKSGVLCNNYTWEDFSNVYDIMFHTDLIKATKATAS